MSPLDQALARFPLPTWRPLASIVMALTGGGLLWASIASVDRIAVAEGVIAPQGQVRTIQHLEGGIAEQILVREGDRVEARQPLMQIDLGSKALNADEIQIRLDALLLERARLQAEAAQVDLVLPKEASARQPDLAAAEQASYRSRRREYESSLAVLRDQQGQKELEIESIVSRLSQARRQLVPLNEHLSIAETLSAARLMPRTQALALRREFAELEGEIASLEIALPRAQTALAEARERALFERNRFRNQASERLRTLEGDLARQRELLAKAEQQRERTLVLSPISGVVKTLHINTLGGVIGGGEPIMEIVPDSEKLVVEARLEPTDIGHVAVGQQVQIKVSTYDYMSYGTLDGAVRHIAADASTTPAGDYFFKLVIETENDALTAGGQRYPISPGMTVTADIKLGQRPVLRYLVEPVMKLRDEAFRDR